IDTDIECFANFDDLHHKYDFYSNLEPPAINKKRVSILNAMLASVPNHPILTNTLTQIRKDWFKVERGFEEKFSASKSSFARSNHNLAVQRTMYPFADSIFKFFKSKDAQKYKTMILPSGYNVPVYFINDVPIINFLSRIFRDKAKLSNQIQKRPETMSIHFHDKENSLMFEDYFANSLFNHSEVRGIGYMIFHLRDKYYLTFRKLFQLKFPTALTYKTNPVIPKIIYVFNEKNLTNNELKELQSKWQRLNLGYIIQTLNKEEMLNLLPKKLQHISEESKLTLARFYLLNNKGGVFVTSQFEPLSLREFNYKYAYFGSFNRLQKLNDPLSLKLEIIGSIKNHNILNNLILNIENQAIKSKNIGINTIKKAFIEYVYRYSDLDGNNIIFPEVLFDQKRLEYS
ncbi:MAG: hypothetical protein AABY27_01040, partial [Pseudomonadota bacterium]